MAIAPELGLGVFVTTNTEGGARLTGVLPARIVEHFYAPPAEVPPAGSPELLKSAATYQGYYLQTRRPNGGLQGFLLRLLVAQVAVTPDGYLTFGLMGENQRFLPADQRDQFRSVDGQSGPFGGVLFKRDGDRAIRIEALELALERVGPLFEPPTLGLLAGLALLASLAVLVGTVVRRGRGLAQTRMQRLAAYLQTAGALAWLTSAGAAGAFAASVADSANLVYNWPTSPILVFSTAALAASLLAAVTVLLLPAVWRRAPVAGWTWWRKLRFTLTTLIFAAFGGILALWDALQPWNP
jgi:hypothetical protein